MGQILGNHRGHGRVGVGDAPDVLQRRINSLEKQLQESKRRERRLENHVREPQSTVDWSKRERSQVEDHNMQLQRDLSAKEEIISQLRAQVANLESQVTARDWVINRNDIHVTDHELGSGAWGTVCKGRFRGCDVAVKKMHEAINETSRRVFEREVNMASKFRHPCLLLFIGATTDERPLLVTELLECSLRNKLFPSPGELPVENGSFISLDVAYALLYLHERANPILHNDVSSSNVLLWRTGRHWRAKLSDYGTANFVRRSNINYAGAAVYCAPEYTGEENIISCKADVFSYGVLLCEMSTRQEPIREKLEEQIDKIERNLPNPIIRPLVRRCVFKKPGLRPAVSEIIEDLKRCALRTQNEELMIEEIE